MKQILLFHPVGQLFAFIFGIFNIITGLTKRCFIVNIHMNCGLLYYFMSALGFCMGISVYSWAAGKGILFSMQFHLITGTGLIILFIAGAASGFILRQNSHSRQRLRTVHKWANIASILLFSIQSITGSIALYRVM